MRSTNRFIGLVVVVILLVLVGAVMLVSTAMATDPAPETVVDTALINLASGRIGYDADSRLRADTRWFGMADIYLTAALSETDQLVMTVQSSPDGVHAWVDSANVFTFTAATAPAFQHVRVPLYGLAVGIDMNISGSVRYTPTVYLVLKNNAGQ